VINAVKVNASDKIDKLLHFKWPWEKVVDVANDSIKNGVDAIKDITQ
jgi:hypothetical protein